MEDTKFDLWLDKHPKIDMAYTKYYIELRAAMRKPRHMYDDWRERRFWTPGSFYLDHGYEPCVLVEFNDSSLLGVSMVDGKLKGGCDIHHCGPEKVTQAEARAAAEQVRLETAEDD